MCAQAEALGNVFRTVMYPRYGPAGGGLLRLHSTYRHDLKIYSSDEGRVQTSAAAFTQGLLDLEGDSLTPILVRCALPIYVCLHPSFRHLHLQHMQAIRDGSLTCH